MKLHELFEGDDLIYDVTSDQNALKIGDTRKPKLTLMHLNKIRKMRETKKFDMHRRRKFWAVIYGNGGEDTSEF